MTKTMYARVNKQTNKQQKKKQKTFSSEHNARQYAGASGELVLQGERGIIVSIFNL
jgi:hypothetical protein